MLKSCRPTPIATWWQSSTGGIAIPQACIRFIIWKGSKSKGERSMGMLEDDLTQRAVDQRFDARFPDAPDHIKRLGRDQRGFPVPWFVQWFETDNSDLVQAAVPGEY